MPTNAPPCNVIVSDLGYRRPGITRIHFIAEYIGYTRRGTINYDVVNKIFLTHTHDIELLAAVCIALQTPTLKVNH